MNALVAQPQTSATRFSPDQVDLIERTICKGASDDELRLFMYQAERTGLDPLARQIYAVKRWDSVQRREVMGIQTSIDGFRLIAERSGKYAGQVGPFWCGPDGVWADVWLSGDSPIAARVGVLRHDFKEPCWGVARFTAYAQTKREGGLTSMWTKMGDVMIAKCAEALALRKAFPQELSGLYTSDEMAQATTEDTPTRMQPATQTTIAPAPTVIAPQPAAPPEHDPETGETGPRGLPLPATNGRPNFVTWGSQLIAAFKASKDADELTAWLQANSMTLDICETEAPRAYGSITAAYRTRAAELTGKETVVA